MKEKTRRRCRGGKKNRECTLKIKIIRMRSAGDEGKSTGKGEREGSLPLSTERVGNLSLLIPISQ